MKAEELEPIRCKLCCREVGDQYSGVEENGEFVVVDEKWGLATILNNDDCLCEECGRSITYYQRIK